MEENGPAVFQDNECKLEMNEVKKVLEGLKTKH